MVGPNNVDMTKYCVACEPPKCTAARSTLPDVATAVLGRVNRGSDRYLYTNLAVADRLEKQPFRTKGFFVLLTYLRTAEDEGMQVVRTKSATGSTKDKADIAKQIAKQRSEPLEYLNVLPT